MGNGYKLQRHLPDYAQVILFLRASVSSTANGVNASAFPTGLEEMDGVCAVLARQGWWRQPLAAAYFSRVPTSLSPASCLPVWRGGCLSSSKAGKAAQAQGTWMPKGSTTDVRQGRPT